MEKVGHCVDKMAEAIEAFLAGKMEKLPKLAEQISEAEHEADLAKNDIRNHLPKSLFLPIDRAQLLDILSLQDTIADRAEDVGVLLTFGVLQPEPSFTDDFRSFLKKNVETFEKARAVIRELTELLETSFGGAEAEKVKRMTDQIAYLEHEGDLIQRILLGKLFAAAPKLHYSAFYLWQRLFEAVGSISNVSEKLGNRIRMTLELK
jgi:predicted phosphate transport protein (TIGR00153 family)